MSDREMWVAIRAGILGITKAIEKFVGRDELLTTVHRSLLVIADAIDQRFKIGKYKAS